MSLMKIDVMKNELLSECKRLDRIPTKSEITLNKTLTSPINLRLLFKSNGYDEGYIQFCKENGYKVKKKENNSIFNIDNMTFDSIKILFEDYKKVHGKYPISSDCKEVNMLPTWKKVKIVCGERLTEFYPEMEHKLRVNSLTYQQICQKFIVLSKDKGDALKREEVDLHSELPNFNRILKLAPNTIITFDDFIYSLGYKPKYNIPKKYAEKAIREKQHKLGRNPKYDDFRNPKNNEIGITTINKLWGTFNNMMMDLGFEVNKENMLEKEKSKEEMLKDLQRAIDESGSIPKQRDIVKFNYMSSQSVYHKKFNGLNNAVLELGYLPNKLFKAFKLSTEEIVEQYKEFFLKFDKNAPPSYDVCREVNELVSPITIMRRLDCSWNEFVESIGFKPNENGANYQYAMDGTLCYSTGEFIIHNYFLKREEIEIVQKEALYSSVLEDEGLIRRSGLKRFDWLIRIGDTEYIVEYFGFSGNFDYDYRTQEKKKLLKEDGKTKVFIEIYTKDIPFLKNIIDDIIPKVISA